MDVQRPARHCVVGAQLLLQVRALLRCVHPGTPGHLPCACGQKTDALRGGYACGRCKSKCAFRKSLSGSDPCMMLLAQMCSMPVT